MRIYRKKEIVQGEAKIVKIFSQKTKEALIGVKIEGGSFAKGETVHFFDYDNEQIGSGKIITMKIGPGEMDTISGAKTEFGALINTNTKIQVGWKMRVIVVTRD